MPSKITEEQILLARLVLRRQLYRQLDGQSNFSDAALRAMASLKPTTVEAFRALPDVGTAKISAYANGYIAVVREHLSCANAHMQRELDGSIKGILASLAQQLIGINRRNRMLYTGKLRSRTGIDMTTLGTAQELTSILFDGGHLSVKQTTTPIKGEKSKYDMLIDLTREVNRTARETGSVDLYVGYPYAVGRIESDPFVFTAPLLLFPMQATRESGAISIERDPSRSVLFNSNLVVAVNRLAGKMETVEEEIIEDAAAYDEDDMLQKYARLGVKLGRTSTKFCPYMADEHLTHELRLGGACVLGKFALQGTSLQRDFGRIMNWNKLPKSVLELIENVGKEDLVAKLEQAGDTFLNRVVTVQEKKIHYINALNASQERVLCAMQEKECLVVAGPPGTGKSQVITSVIADFALRGKSILMVTEKKAALDVVRSRLGIVNDFCLQIDDAEDKIGFYEQILRMLGKMNAEKSLETEPYSATIEADLDKLRAIHVDLYTPKNGYCMAQLYRAVTRPDRTNPVNANRWADVERSGFEPSSICYPEFVRAGEKLTQSHNIALLSKWLPILFKGGVWEACRRDLGASEIGAFLVRAKDAIKRLQRAALMNGGTRTKELRDIRARLEPELARVLNGRVSGKVYAHICADLDTLVDIFEDYATWLEAVAYLGAISAGERSLNDAVFCLSAKWSVKPLVAYERVKRYYVGSLIDDFERIHRDELRDMDGYEGIIQRLRSGFSAKSKFTSTNLYDALSADFARVRISKRFGDMRRIAESARHMSVTRFLARFDNELFLGVKIWLLTPEIASAILPLREGMFDLVVFDEASQLYVERAIPALIRGKKTLIVGDNKQLRPSSLGTGRMSMDAETLEEEGIESTALEVDSLLDLAEAKYDRVMLDAHYRSASEELIAFSNYAFYKGKLLISPNLHHVEKPIEVIRVKDGVWENRSNTAEAERAVKLLKQVLTTKGSATVGIITFNSTQRDLIERIIERECVAAKEFNRLIETEMHRKNNGEDIGLFVKNIENVQGDERDIIIFSMGYAVDKAGHFSRNFGWLNAPHGENRLNVAITRARQKIYFITSMDSAEFSVDDLPSQGPRLLKKYMAYAEAVTRGDEVAVKRVLATLGTQSSVKTERQTDPHADTLERQFHSLGYATARNVGIGGVTLDLAVTYPNGKVEGYESDTDVYAIDPDTRSRDYHRRNYLETRGWTIHRIWSHDVYMKSHDDE